MRTRISPSRQDTPASAPRTRDSRFKRPLRAGFAALAGAVPALVIASSARAAGVTASDDWTIGLLALAFAAMLLVLALLGDHLLTGLKQGLRTRDAHPPHGEF